MGKHKGINFNVGKNSCRLFYTTYSRWRNYFSKSDGIRVIQAGRIVLLIVK